MSSLRRPGFGGAVLAIFVVLGAAAPWLAPYDPVEQLDPGAARNRPPLTVLHAVALGDGVWRLADRVERTADGLRIERRGAVETYRAARVRNLTAGGVADRRVFVLGSDQFGRDVLSRLIHGARVSLTIGLLSVALSMTIGVLVGAAAALGGRLVDAVLMRLVDGLTAIPWIFLLITLTAFFSTGTGSLILLLGATTWPLTSRLTRAEVLSLKERDFVIAARGLGAGPMHVFWRHLLPHALTPLVVTATLQIGALILFEASLSFLGFGVQPPEPSWGNMIADGRGQMFSAWWVVVFPGAALTLTVVAINLVGDRLRDLLDPRRATAPISGATAGGA